MLFNSLEFLLVFVPATFFLFIGTRRLFGAQAAIIVVCLASTYFYAHWSIKNAPILLASITFDFIMGSLIVRERNRTNGRPRLFLISAIAFDLGLLGFFKYTRFVVETINTVAGSSFHLPDIPLPLGISFYTFQQIAFLAACGHAGFRLPPFRNYFFLVSYFPHLIAGPLILHKMMFPQLARSSFGKISPIDIQSGLTLLVLGLAKKVLIADNLAEYANLYFAHVGVDSTTFVEAWLGVLAYTFQLYFDFSGYSDMAIGLGRLFGLHIPVNFYSPYKATSIIDFWRRWHITLSQFLRDYIYIPLGGSRFGFPRQMLALQITMALCGLWHGANWTFILWGIYHGALLGLNHVYKRFAVPAFPVVLPKPVGWMLTFVLVCIGWALFRSPNFQIAQHVIVTMFNPFSIVIPLGYESYFATSHTLSQIQSFLSLQFGSMPTYKGVYQIGWIIFAALIAFKGPSLIDIFNVPRDPPSQGRGSGVTLVWRPNAAWAVVTGVLAFLCLASINRPSEFLYFNF